MGIRVVDLLLTVAEVSYRFSYRSLNSTSGTTVLRIA
jgi:hypothetical protein